MKNTWIGKRGREKMLPKVLVLSNECFSASSSNGRTLGNFFVNWEQSHLAQFYILGKPDSYYCKHYFHVSDKQALNAFLCGSNVGGEVSLNNNDLSTKKEVPQTHRSFKQRKNALTMLLRNTIWINRRWKIKSGLYEWVDKFNPDIVLLQAGDCAFMYKLSVELSKRNNASLVIYNSEGYYYKDYDYFRASGLEHKLYPVFHKQLREALKEAYSNASCVVYICDELKERYSKDFFGRSETVYTGSDIQYEKKKGQNKVFTTVYCGNLGLKRHESLIEIAEVLQSISEDLFIEVYGKAPTQEVTKMLEECQGIHYHGVVSYEEVRAILRDSDLILYVESFDPFYQEDTKFGFSTKIADSLSSGNCFLLYAPQHFACYQYLKKNKAAYTASNKKELEIILRELVQNPNNTEKYKEAALQLAEKNHRVEKNKERFKNILCEITSLNC